MKIIKLEESNNKLKCQPINIPPLIKGIISSINHLATQQELKITLESSLDSPHINGNAEAFETALNNILINAIKFTPNLGLISIKIWQEEPDLCISITDTGIGISAKDQQHIFERFKQVDASSTKHYSGTRIGLALAHDLILAQGGKITVDSALDKGSTFTLVFPIIYPDKQIPNSITNSSHTIQNIYKKADFIPINMNNSGIIPFDKAMDTIDQIQLLIIEDEPDMRHYLVSNLQSHYQVYTASNGKEGLALALQHQPDIVLTDLMLPKLDGLEICKQIKNHPSLKFTKVILLTARNNHHSKLTALKNGADDFLTKPFSTIELISRLNNISRVIRLEKRLTNHNTKLNKALTDLRQMKSQLLHSEKINAIGSLAAGLLHEVNNPLNYTTMAAQILKRDPHIMQDNDLLELVEDINNGMNRIKIIVKDLRTFAYPEKSEIRLPYSLNSAVKSALRFTASITHDIDINNLIDKNTMVIGSESHIVQVFINLITNAVQAMNTVASPSITITATPSQNNTDHLTVCIEDNGKGIAPKNLTRIFDPFFTTRDVGEGLGLGLSTCHTIIENNAGVLWAESKLGQYTKFKFDLPLKYYLETSDRD
ncbi:MAG TPA: response regulator [Leucothrix sp.]|nr:response regulator [Leucothrix sp.]